MQAIESDWQQLEDIVRKQKEGGEIRSSLKARQLLSWRKVTQGVPEDRLTGILSELLQEHSSWQDHFRELLQAEPPPAATLPGPEGGPVAPFVSFARRKLQEAVAPSDLPRLEKLVEKLEALLRGYAERAVVAYREKYPGRAGGPVLPFFNEYPVLARLCTTRTVNWVKGTLLFLRRLSDDLPTFGRLTGRETRWEDIDAILPLNSDIHSFAGEVLQVQFSNGTSLIYKPKSPAADQFLGQLQQRFNELSGKDLFMIPGLLPHRDYFWQETVVPDAPAAVAKDRFYPSAGRFLALCNLLLMEDYHAENVLVCHSRLTAVDNEFILPPLSPVQANFRVAADPVVNSSYFSSVLNVKVLPDLYSLFYNDFTDNYALAHAGPAAGPEEVRLLQEGFLELVTLFKENEAPLTAFIRGELGKVPATRYLVRNTADYYHLAGFLSQPEKLASSLEFFLSLIHNLAPAAAAGTAPEQGRILAEEAAFLFQFDIPHFFAPPGTLPGDQEHGRFERQLRNWSREEFIGSQLEMLAGYGYTHSNNGFYLAPVSGGTPDPGEVAVKLAQAVACLYRWLFYDRDTGANETAYFTRDKGLPGVLQFLAAAYSKSPDGGIKKALDALAGFFLSAHQEVFDRADDRDKTALLDGWVKTVCFVAPLCPSPLVKELHAAVLQKARTFPGKGAGCGSDPDDLLQENRLLQIPPAPGNDTLADGNFALVARLLQAGIEENDPALLAAARKRCHEVLDLRRHTGFQVPGRAINAFLQDGLSGIGLVLLLLSDQELYPAYKKYVF